MRRIAASWLLAVLVLRAVLPALPVYVCLAMGGEHLLSPCCAPDEAGELNALPAITMRCCVPESPATIDLQRAPQVKERSAIAVAAQLAVSLPPQLPCADPPIQLRPQVACNGPPPIGPPPPLRKILRI